jgi:hypothetical protein
VAAASRNFAIEIGDGKETWVVGHFDGGEALVACPRIGVQTHLIEHLVEPVTLALRKCGSLSMFANSGFNIRQRIDFPSIQIVGLQSFTDASEQMRLFLF